ncbi:MAG TPA: YceI family protein [Candidatus Nanopelagicales bacterium]|nr:YceI family protein [Candidatus Nanopelagicales bacterium]
MRWNTKRGDPGSAAALALAGTALALAGCGALPPRAADIAVLPPPPRAAPAGAVESYRLGPDNTRVEAQVTALGDYTIGFTRLEGRLELRPAALEDTSVQVVVDTRSLEALPLVEGVARSPSFLDVERFPEARFSSRRLTAGDAGRYRLVGELELHGVRRPVAVPAEVVVDACIVHVRSEFSIARRDYCIRGEGALGDIIGDDVVLRIESRLVRASAPPGCEGIGRSTALAPSRGPSP